MSTTNEIAIEKHSDQTGAKIGMWLFLFTELLLFGGMFLLYAVYRFKHAHEFHVGALELDKMLGTLNTMFLLTSSLTMALSISALQRMNRKLSSVFLVITILLGITFLVVKYFEWSAKIAHGIYPGSADLSRFYKDGEILFFGLYYAMTGLHGLHIIVGVVILSVMLFFINKQPKTEFSIEPDQVDGIRGSQIAFQDASGKALLKGIKVDDSVRRISVLYSHEPGSDIEHKSNLIKLENSGLYWHLVDIIWIFLFPLFYLIS
ncbi:cytochrome c oxidase subunit 3 [candidate division KSB1 bacterium]|nr:cytochrome c oxidase subunit 3 [candidate division KSB1 bacterium]